MCKIELTIMTYINGTSCPVYLSINDKMYYYGEDNLFEQLEPYIGKDIIVNYIGHKTNIKVYELEEYLIIDKMPTIKLKNKGENIEII